ncbi:MAG: VCBS repeat-containing protein, partial [Bacteroidota bacterium]
MAFSQLLQRADSIQVYENGKKLGSQFTGGLSLPQFSPMDLNGDGTLDLFCFDRDVNKAITFLNGGTPNTVDYTHAPQYQDQFPKGLSAFTLARDYDCDGNMDLFTSNGDVMALYRWTAPGPMPYTLVTDTVLSDFGSGPEPLPVLSDDIPAIIDVEGDGYLDILTFEPNGTFLEWHRNVTFDSTGSCNGFELIRADGCWGKFGESALGNNITLNQSCRLGPTPSPIPSQDEVHGGSTVAAFDEDGDGDLEIFLGDLLYADMVFLRNGGTNTNALIDSVQYAFPLYDAKVNLWLSPGGFFFDADNDSLTDFICTPQLINVSVNQECNWMYKNVGNSVQATFNQVSKTFLLDDMVDVGRGAYPVFFDQNGDSLLDLVIGNVTYKPSDLNEKSALT